MSKKIEALLKNDAKLGVRDKGSKLSDLFEATELIKEEQNDDKTAHGLVNPAKLANMLAGGTANLKDLLYQEKDTDDVKFKLTDSDEKIEEAVGKALEIDERAAELIRVCKKLVDWALLNDLLDGEQYISNAFVKRYEQHHDDLEELRRIFKEHHIGYETTKSGAESEVFVFFKRDYAAYVGNYDRKYRNNEGKSAPKHVILKDKVNYEQSTINEKIKKLLEEKFPEVDQLDDFGDITVDEKGKAIKTRNMPEEVQKLYNSAVEGELLPKQKGQIGSTIPYQIHHAELFEIVKQMVRRYPSLALKLSDETSARDDKTDDTFLNPDESEQKAFPEDCAARRVLQLHRFRIPYYIGHLSQHQEDGIIERQLPWAVRDDGEVTPWNFDARKGGLVRLDASAEEFIKRMTSKCTYLRKEDVLAKNSMLYSKFSLLNELNNLKINGKRIEPRLKHQLFEGFYVQKRTSTLSATNIKKWLKEQGIDAEVSGLNASVKGNYNSYHDYKKVFAGELNDTTREQFEKIVEWVMLLKESKDMLKSKIEKEYGALSEERWKAIKNLNYTGWGRLSKKLLEEIKIPRAQLEEERLKFTENVSEEGVDGYTAQDISIIEAMEFGNYNLMELMTERYGFTKKIEEENGDGSIEGKLKYEEVDQYYASPSVKKMVWQTLKVVEELRKVAGKEPKKIMIEMARSEETKKQTASRKTQLAKAYEAIKSDVDAASLLEKLGKEDQNRLKAKNVYLYYTQMGKCMYCGESISEEALKTGSGIDIDHIWPRSKTKDDSLTRNLVLVHAQGNRSKGDSYPLQDGLCGGGKDLPKWLWDKLKSKDGKTQGLITKEKYDRLTRRDPLGEDELAKFINRQLVETRQSTKIVAEILKRVLPETEIIYVKGNDVSEFRQQYKITKVREMNDLHHAKDAYLNIVVGNVMHEKFTKKWYADSGKYDARKFHDDVNGDKVPSLNFHAIFGDGAEKERKDGTKYRREPVHANYKTGEIFWDYSEHGSAKGKIAIQARKNDVLVSEEVYESRDAFYKATVFAKGDSTGDIPLKLKDERFENTERYGKFSSLQTAKMVLTRNTAGGKKNGECKFEQFPTIISKTKDNAMRAKLLEKYLPNKEILLEVKLNSLLIWNGYPLRLRGIKAYKNAYQISLDAISEKNLKQVVKYAAKVPGGDSDAAKKKRAEVVPSSYEKITCEQNLQLYDVLTEISDSKKHRNRMNNITPILQSGREKFAALGVNDQVLVIMEILGYWSDHSKDRVDLRLIGGTKANGANGAAFNVSNATSAVLVTQSVTGLYEQRIDLKKLAEIHLREQITGTVC